MSGKRYVDVFHPRRELGRTGFRATAVGIGDIADRAVPLEACVATLRRALEAGMNVIDTAPGYEAGYGEQMVGQAVREHGREKVFVIDKVDHLHEPVAPQVEASLRTLGLEAADGFLFHAVSQVADWRRIASPGGGMEQLDACRRQGRCRFVGLSTHHPDVAREAVESGLCDLILLPIGPWVDRRYTDEVLPLAKARGIGTFTMKTFAAGKLICDTSGYGKPLAHRPRGKLSSGGSDEAGAPALPRLSVRECVHYTLSWDADVSLLGMSFPNEQDPAFEAVLDFPGPLPAVAMADIRTRALAAVEGKGTSWWDPPRD
ncbi:MAG: aldo/keto reductase [Planctomycetota bacterium]|nr:aldo/keto reductase [Planctomycetota bacterium]